jgi:hypothetical protein
MGCGAAAVFGWLAWAGGDELRDREELREPVYRVSKIVPQDRPVEPAQPDHPLDPAIEIARHVLTNIRTNIQDYTCRLIKRENVDGELKEYEYMFCKVRSEQVEDGQVVVPFSVYLQFLKPDSLKGQEVIYVDGHNGNRLIAHQGGWKGRLTPTVELLPNSMLAMRGNKYPITEIGLENLAEKLIERAELDRRFPCQVRILEDTRVGDRSCRCIEVVHSDARPQVEFQLARVFVDNELQLPIRYEAYGWPKRPGGNPELIEEYTYTNLKVNVGLTDRDFDRNNPSYNF